MKKVSIWVSTIVLLMVVATANVSAYGGGGFPPGYYDNPHTPGKLVCELVKKKLPNGREVTVPSCKVVKVEKPQPKTLGQRLSEFVSRITHGGK